VVFCPIFLIQTCKNLLYRGLKSSFFYNVGLYPYQFFYLYYHYSSNFFFFKKKTSNKRDRRSNKIWDHFEEGPKRNTSHKAAICNYCGKNILGISE